ncbi:MAG: NHL repeat-containing protein [Isosphaeraceae bacterium]
MKPMISTWIPRAVLSAVLLAVAGATEVRAGYADLLATNIGGGTVTQYNPVTGAPVGTGVFASTPLVNPRGIAIGPNNNVFVNDLNGGVYQFNGTTGALVNTFVAPGTIGAPHGMTFGSNGNLYVASLTGNSILQYQGPGGGSPGTLVSTINTGGLNAPTGIAFGLTGDLYVSNSGTNQILRYDSAGAFQGIFASGNGLNLPAGLSIAPDGSLLVANDGGNSVLRFNTTTGALLNTLTNAALSGVGSAVYDGFGHVLVSSYNNNSIVSFNLDLATNTGSFDKVLVSGVASGLNTPIYLSVPVPEPGSFALVALGTAVLGGLSVARLRRSV